MFRQVNYTLLLKIFYSFRPKENEKIREELEMAVQIIWNCRLPSPRVSEATKLFLLLPSPYKDNFFFLFLFLIFLLYQFSVLQLMLLSRMNWFLRYKCPFSLRLSSQKQGRFCTVRKVISRMK